MSISLPHADSRCRRALILLDRKMESAFADKLQRLISERAVDQRDVVLLVDFQQLENQIDSIRGVLEKHDLDFILFSRNDQIFDRRSIGPLIRDLRVGYSTFSAIDSDAVWEQSEHCLQDYFGTPQRLSLPQRKGADSVATPEPGAQTFSLIFDLEQLAGARYGLPRVLNLLHEFEAGATFFATSIINEVYPGTVKHLIDNGHEVGLHGRYHEYLSGHGVDRQSQLIRQMKFDFQDAEPIRGANFIYRMDHQTVDALIRNRLDYFVLFREHRYAPFRFCDPPLRPMTVCTVGGSIQMVPVSVETYNRPWFAVKNMIDSAIATGRNQEWKHFNILCHPFRDGSVRHLSSLRKLLQHMTRSQGYQPCMIQAVIDRLPRYEPDCFVYYDIDTDNQAALDKSYWNRWWHNRRRYELRVGRLFESLRAAGRQPALSLTPDCANCLSVFPYLPDNVTGCDLLELDPLDYRSADPAFVDLWRQRDFNGNGLVCLPRNFGQDLRVAVRTMVPGQLRDFTAMVPECALRAAYRMSPGQKLF